MSNYCFGVDVGGTTVKCGLFQIDGTLLEKWEIKTNTKNNGEKILPDVAQTVLDKIEEKKIKKEEIAGIGIGVPGPVDDKGVVHRAVNLHWGEKDIKKELGDLTGLLVEAGNDANVAALGEMWKGGGEGFENLIMVTLGTGVGGGIIEKGKIISGVHGAGGEIGHATVNPNETESCNCGKTGCLEQYASATGISRIARETLNKEKNVKTTLTNSHLSAKDVFDAYKQGDEMATMVIKKFADYLGMALANFVAVLDPDIIVIGGGVSKAGQVLIDVVDASYKNYVFHACKETPIVLAKLGNDAGIYGSARLVLE